MPMPQQRKPRPPQQLLLNNNGLAPSARYNYNSVSGPCATNSTSTVSPLPNAHQPPLITDTLTACLDVNGTYICTSYSPRCYIIQKVTQNSVTVTPHVPGGNNGASTPTSQQVCSAGPSSRSQPPGKFLPQSQLGVIPPPVSAATQCLPFLQHLSHPHHLHHHHHNHHHNSEFPGSELSSLSLSPSQQDASSSGSSSSVTTSPSKGSSGGTRLETNTLPPPTASGRAFMNGDTSNSVAGSVEGSMPSMASVLPGNIATGTSITDTRSLNGLRDGAIMPRDQMSLNNDVADAEADLSSRRGYNDHGHNPMVYNSDLPMEDLRRMLLSQLEYYFSPENLANDKFLVSQMDSDHYVYISTLANFNMIKKLTSDLDLITDVLRDSKNVQVHPDGKRVRHMANRTVVILRGIPNSTPVDEIKALFDSENCPRCNGCEFAFNDSWYVSFESDEDAQRAYRYLREDVKEFRGQPIMARIKSKPTTLLAQGVGVPTLKNGFPPQQPNVLPPYIASPYVPVSQPGQTSAAVTATPIFQPGQQVPSVFTLPPNYSGYQTTMPGWPASFYDINSSMGQMYSINGLPPQPQPSPNYPKSAQMAPRQRTTKSESESFNRGQQPGRGPRRTVSNPNDSQPSNGGGSGPPHQYNSNQQRKNGAPPPLLGMAPSTLPLVSHPPINHHAHPTVPVSGSAAAISQNGRQHYMTTIPSQQPHVPHNVPEPYHHATIRPPFRGDSRPRSSLSRPERKGPQRRDDEGNNDYNAVSVVAPNRNIPSNRVLAAPTSPQIATPVILSGNPHASRINFDLEGSAFPPLPGSGISSYKNGDSPYEGRLSDVVKGVKNMKVSSGSLEKEEGIPITTLSAEIIVSVAEPAHVATHVVSAASPTREVELTMRKEARDIEQISSHIFPPGNKKEFREVGVGSADDSHDIRSSLSKNSIVGGSKGKETADKSTRTDEALLNGDQPNGPGVNVGSKSGGVPMHIHQSHSVGSGSSVGGVGGYRKSMPQSAKSPSANKRTVPAFQTPAISSTAVGSEVPYSMSSSRNVTSPVSSPAKPTYSAPSGSGNPHNPYPHNANPGMGRGANTYVAKTQVDNNHRASGGNGHSGPSNLNTSDKDAFPAPGFVKTVPTATTKPFSGSTDHSPKEVNRTEDIEREKRDGGHGDEKKLNENHCSNDEREGPVRLSYAQVAQSGKEKPPNTQTVQSSHGNPTSAHQGPGSTTGSHEDKKKPIKDTKESRTLPKTQRGNNSGGGDRNERDRDRDTRVDRGFRRNFRNRMSSDHSSQDGGGGRQSHRGTRSPK